MSGGFWISNPIHILVDVDVSRLNTLDYPIQPNPNGAIFLSLRLIAGCLKWDYKPICSKVARGILPAGNIIFGKTWEMRRSDIPCYMTLKKHHGGPRF